MSRQILASALLLALALTSAGCCGHKTCAVRPAPPCCPPPCPPPCSPGGPIVGPAVPAPPPVTAGFPPGVGWDAPHLR